ncbi:MAG TPA: toll/interleukin-1 receptor domain-containing protein [Thermoanaerobaculia bacterium]|nr:toll/interleukin-1 receptor domain-containing protein [Thermoanaerobaculia bacterium]
MDIINSTGIHTEYRVVSHRDTGSAKPEAWQRLRPNDYVVVRPSQAGPWKIELRIPGGQPLAEVVNSPKASVVLEEAAGRFKVQASVAGIDALITYSPSTREWAEKLDAALRGAGLSTWIDFRDLKSGISAWDQLREVIVQVKNAVVLVGSKDDATERQRIEKAVALGAVSENPSQRMIPLLLDEAELPGFVRAAAQWSERPIPSIRIADPARDWDRAVADVIEVLRGEADPRAKGEVIDTSEEDRRRWQERMDYLRQFAAELKIQEDRARLERFSAKTA